MRTVQLLGSGNGWTLDHEVAITHSHAPVTASPCVYTDTNHVVVFMT